MRKTLLNSADFARAHALQHTGRGAGARDKLALAPNFVLAAARERT
jgi:hypothetical protein